jgi:hypothetical protein
MAGPYRRRSALWAASAKGLVSGVCRCQLVCSLVALVHTHLREAPPAKEEARCALQRLVSRVGYAHVPSTLDSVQGHAPQRGDSFALHAGDLMSQQQQHSLEALTWQRVQRWCAL